MDEIQSSVLHVPGARLAYEAQGSGPLLLLIPGGEGGGDGYDALATRLAGSYKIVTYDRRGASRSPPDDPARAVRLEDHADDAHHLLATLADNPAYIFGSSAGALIGLDLAIRYPKQVRLLVAHEPPVEGLVPEFDAFQAATLETYRREGPAGALARFVRELGIVYARWEPGVQPPPRSAHDPAVRGEALIRYTFQAVHGYRLDVVALAASPARVVLAGGSDGRDNPAYRSAAALAKRLGTTLLEFPAHHAGYINQPTAFAEVLREVLRGRQGEEGGQGKEGL